MVRSMQARLQSKLRHASAGLLAVVVVIVLFARPVAAENIDLMEVDIRVSNPATLDITETIHMNFGSAKRRGIFRNIPYKYKRGVAGLVDSFTVDVRIDSVTDENGKAWQYKTSRAGGVLNLRIGDPDVFLTGRQTYVIKYTARRAINFHDGPTGNEPEIYWNATGNEWLFPISRADVTLQLPPGVTPADTKAQAFFGPEGSTNRIQPQPQDDTWTFTARDIRQGDGLTIGVRLPAGSVEQATLLTRLRWFLLDWWPVILFPAISLASMYALWLSKGRDEGGGQAIPVEWNPPSNLSPAEVGTIVDEVCHTQDVIATIIDLAARGFLRIERHHTDKLLGLSKRDYQLTRLKRPDATLLPHEKDMMDGLFDGRKSVKISKLKGKFHATIRGIQNDIYKELAEREIFNGNPSTIRGSWAASGVAIIVAGIVLTFMLSNFGVASFGAGVALAGVPVIIIGLFMPAKTLKGSTLLREIRGFRRFLMMVEKDRLKNAVDQDPTIFGRLLPYAMVLGVEDEWAGQFDDLLTQPPEWFRDDTGQAFSAGLFMSQLGDSTSTMGTALSAVPASKGAGGGSSSFSSGGGFSGGGFGGGGGGSW